MTAFEHQNSALSALLSSDADKAWEQLQHLNPTELLTLNIAAYQLAGYARDCRRDLIETERKARA